MDEADADDDRDAARDARIAELERLLLATNDAAMAMEASSPRSWSRPG